MEVAWSKVRVIRRMLEDFPLLLLNDYARPHPPNKTNETLRNFKWEVGTYLLTYLRIIRGWYSRLDTGRRIPSGLSLTPLQETKKKHLLSHSGQTCSQTGVGQINGNTTDTVYISLLIWC
jgi:hypothetical protein